MTRSKAVPSKSFIAWAILFLGSAGALVEAEMKADNSAANRRDRNALEVTADNQSNDAADLELTRKIRRAVHQEKNVSTYSHNVKIITVNGRVTLKGPVRSEAEKNTLEKLAGKFAGAENVINEMAVAPTGSKDTVQR